MDKPAPAPDKRATTELGQTAAAANCSICGGTDFVPAPNNRLSLSGRPPLCVTCRSLERDRIGHKVVDGIRDRERFLKLDLL